MSRRWFIAGDRTRQWLDGLNESYADLQEGDPGGGIEFLAMHRAMIEHLDGKFGDVGIPESIRDGAGFSVIHLLSAWTLVSLALAVHFIRRGNVRAHKGFMIGTFLGLAGAGLGALAPGRALYLFLFA